MKSQSSIMIKGMQLSDALGTPALIVYSSKGTTAGILFDFKVYICKWMQKTWRAYSIDINYNPICLKDINCSVS